MDSRSKMKYQELYEKLNQAVLLGSSMYYVQLRNFELDLRNPNNTKLDVMVKFSFLLISLVISQGLHPMVSYNRWKDTSHV